MANNEISTNCIKCKKIVLDNQNSICCDDCDGWLHLKCSGLTLKEHKKLGNDKKSTFKCKFCIKYKCGKCDKPVYQTQNGVMCDSDHCQTWFHLKCTRFTLAEYMDKKSRLHSDHWYCPNCTCIPFSELPQNEFMNLQNDDKRLKEYFSYVTSDSHFTEKCTICEKKVYRTHIKKSFPCTSCKAYIHRKCTGIPLSDMLQGKPHQFKYWNCKSCISKHFPLTDLDDSEVNKLSFDSNFQCKCLDKGENTPLDCCETFKLADTFLPKDSPFIFGPNPNIDLSYDINANCNYYSNHDFHKLTKSYKDKEKKPFTALHTNIESLMHNFDSLEQLCIELDYPLDIIAVTETWNPAKNRDKFVPKFLAGYEAYK